nr:reverse transcriptase domain-containing protein [Tanacetum cinerariifolium]
MPVEMVSFDIMIGMNWLSKYHVVIICDEKIVCIPFGNETLIIHGDESSNEHGSRLNIISCTKTQKYLLKGCHSSRYDESVMASKPKTIQDAIDFATELMDQKIHTLAECQDKNKRKFEDTSRNNQNQQQPFKRHNVARAYTTGPREKKSYGGSKPLCPKCNYQHDEQYAPKCTNCKRTGHSAWDCRS